MKQFVILVDEIDNPIGIEEKLKAHQLGKRHRAFSVFILRKHPSWQVLLQQRNFEKYHCGGLWTNTCCSHPSSYESTLVAARRRLKEEMGIEVPLQEIGVFHYEASVGQGLTENEIDHVLIGFSELEAFQVNPSEVADYRWVDISILEKDLQKNPSQYTPWLAPALRLLLSYIS